jgi:hypothetical protein
LGTNGSKRCEETCSRGIASEPCTNMYVTIRGENGRRTGWGRCSVRSYTLVGALDRLLGHYSRHDGYRWVSRSLRCTREMVKVSDLWSLKLHVFFQVLLHSEALLTSFVSRNFLGASKRLALPGSSECYQGMADVFSYLDCVCHEGGKGETVEGRAGTCTLSTASRSGANRNDYFT